MTLTQRLLLLAFAVAGLVVLGGALHGTPAVGVVLFVAPFPAYIAVQVMRGRR